LALTLGDEAGGEVGKAIRSMPPRAMGFRLGVFVAAYVELLLRSILAMALGIRYNTSCTSSEG
jgi:hypothetical protein